MTIIVMWLCWKWQQNCEQWHGTSVWPPERGTDGLCAQSSTTNVYDDDDDDGDDDGDDSGGGEHDYDSNDDDDNGEEESKTESQICFKRRLSSISAL